MQGAEECAQNYDDHILQCARQQLLQACKASFAGLLDLLDLSQSLGSVHDSYHAGGSQIGDGQASSLLLTEDRNLRNAAYVSGITAVDCASLPRQPLQLWDLCTSCATGQKVRHLMT